MSDLQILQQALVAHDRIAITGAPKCGKTTLSTYVMDRPLVHTDDFMHLEWSAASKAVAEHANSIKGKVLIEGVAVPRALRKGMKVDAVIVLGKPHIALNIAQQAMAKGIQTVLAEWRCDVGTEVKMYYA